MIKIEHLNQYFVHCKAEAYSDLANFHRELDTIESNYQLLRGGFFGKIWYYVSGKDSLHRFKVKSLHDAIRNTQAYIDRTDGYMNMIAYRDKYDVNSRQCGYMSETDPILARVNLDSFYAFMKKEGNI